MHHYITQRILVTHKPYKNKKVKLGWGWHPQNNYTIDFNHFWWFSLLKKLYTLLDVTLLKYFYTLLGVCPIRGIKNIQLRMSPC